MTPEQARVDFERIHRAIDDNDFKLATKLERGLFTAVALVAEGLDMTGPSAITEAARKALHADIIRAKTIASLALDAQQIAFERDWT